MMTAAGGDPLSVEDVFHTQLYRGSNANQQVTNGIDLSTEGGLLWFKSRSDTDSHRLINTEVGLTKALSTHLSAQETNYNASYPWLTSFNTDGYTIGNNNDINYNGYDYVGFTFRKAPKFFDIVTYTGNGTQGRTISHNLGSAPGCIIVKRRDAGSSDWAVYHRGLTSALYGMKLNSTTDEFDADSYWDSTDPTASVFSVGNNASVNTSGGTYVAYLWAHNNNDGEFGPSGDQDIIKCGSYAGNSSFQEIDIGFEPQWLLVKAVDDSNNTYARWAIFNTTMTWAAPSYQAYEINPNTSNGERNGYSNISPSHTGFTLNDGAQQVNAGSDYIYIAIRKGPMRAGDTATNLFGIDSSPTTASGGQPLFTTGFKTDLGIYRRTTTTASWNWVSRPVDRRILISNTNDSAQNSGSDKMTFMNGFTDAATVSNYWGIGWAHSPGFFDSVHYRGTGSATGTNTFRHNLGVKPEMIFIKCVSHSANWIVWHKDMNYNTGESYTNKAFMNLNNSNAATLSSNYWSYGGNPQMTDTHFSLGSTYDETNNTSRNYVAFLMASLSGISKLGSYTGNGGTSVTGNGQDIDCGFSSGARFVLIKPTDAGDHWFVYDTGRGIVAGNDATLQFNLMNGQSSSSDEIDPLNSGFRVLNQNNQLNRTGRNYIFWAVA